MLNSIIIAIGLVLIIEGFLYGVFPSAAKRMADMLEQTPPDTIKTIGLLMAAAGLVIVWLALP